MADDSAQTHVWTIGNYPLIAEHLLPISEGTLAALEIQPQVGGVEAAARPSASIWT